MTTEEKPKYFNPSPIMDEVSCTPTRDIKLSIEFFNGAIRFNVYNAASGGRRNPIWEAKLKPIEFASMLSAMKSFLNKKVALDHNKNHEGAFSLTAYNAEAANKRVIVGELALVYNGESKKLMWRVTSKAVDSQMFAIYVPQSVDTSSALDFTDAGGKFESLLNWVNTIIDTAIFAINDNCARYAVWKRENPRPMNGNRPGGQGGGFNGNKSGGNSNFGNNRGFGGGGNNSTGNSNRSPGGVMDDLEDELPF